MSFPRYPAYKDSGVAWLGEVPAHWEVKRLRHVTTLNPSKSEVGHLSRETEVSFLPMDAVGDDGTLNLDRTRPIGEVESGYTYFREGDVTIAKITPCFENGKGAVMRALHNGHGFGTTELIVARPSEGCVTSDYLHLLFTSQPFRRLGEAAMYGAGGQKRVPDDFVRDFAVALPPPEEQTAIATFLGHETSKIDALVAEQELLIELLKEKRQAVISRAVTKGLDPSVPMKDSGVEWLGEVPAHWTVTRLGSVFREVSDLGNDDLPILSVSIHDGVSDKELNEAEMDRKVTRSEDRSKYKVVSPGDLTYNMMRAWQGAFGAVTVHGQVSPAYVVARPISRVETSFVEQVLRTPQAVEQMRRHSKGVTDFRLRLYWEEFKNIRIALPPLAEQSALLRAISLDIDRFDALTAEAKAVITLLKERRTALISAAVTGQVDVRSYTQS